MSRLERAKGFSFRLRPLVGVVLFGAVLASCSSATLAFSSGPGPCFVALPVAQRAVASEKQYLGVRLIDRRTASSILDHQTSSNESEFCLVAYRQTRQHTTTGAQTVNRFTLVVVSPKTRQVIGVSEVARLPFSFRRNLSVG